jgi:hypothetical protein
VAETAAVEDEISFGGVVLGDSNEAIHQVVEE